LQNISKEVGNTNSALIKDFVKSYKALPDNPSTRRILMVVYRLKTISKLMKNKALDKLNEEDLKVLNMALRDNWYKSAQDYRKTLKKFLKTKDKKKYFDLIDSDYLKAPTKRPSAKSNQPHPKQ
jgi:uncharacterized protein (DUF2267 family)